jgi:hypothetical protein
MMPKSRELRTVGKIQNIWGELKGIQFDRIETIVVANKVIKQFNNFY